MVKLGYRLLEIKFLFLPHMVKVEYLPSKVSYNKNKKNDAKVH